MANEKISAMATADLPLDGTELVPIVQDGDNKQCTAQDIADLGGGGGGAVSSVFGRAGAVVSVTNDYTAAQIANVAAGNIAATNVQTALNELDTEKAPLASPALTGNPTAPTQSPGDNSTKLATTAYADAIAALKANLASPTFTGTPAAPTASFGTNTTQLATTAFVQAALVGLFEIRGDFDASVNAYPSSGGSGTAGAILKADAWVISVGGTLPTGQVVTAGDWIFAKVDTPGNTQANWARIESNLTYVPVNKAGDLMSGALAMGTNKITGLGAATASGDALRYEQLINVPTVLTDGASVSWELNKLMFPMATWAAATATTTLSFATSGNVLDGAMGSLKITTGTASAITITFPAGFTHKTQNVTFTTYTLPAGTGKDYVLTFWVKGTTLEWVIGVASPKVVQLACSDESSILNTGTNKIKFRMPYAMTLTEVRASLGTAQATNGPYGGIFTVDVNKNGTTILSTKLTIDNTEKTSVTAATPAVISVSALADDDEIEVDIDQVGDGTAAGLKLTLLGV
jgi:hypothetical protein